MVKLKGLTEQSFENNFLSEVINEMLNIYSIYDKNRFMHAICNILIYCYINEFYK